MARVKPTRRKGGTPPAGAARKPLGKGKGGAVIQPRSSIVLPTEHGWQQLNCSEDCNAQRGDMAERVTCDGCNRMWHAACLGLHAHDPSGKWHCASCTAMYRRGVEDGQQQVPAASQPTVAGTVAVAEPSSKRKKFCCQVPGCRQADNKHDYKSSYHLKTHHQQAHEEPRHMGRAPGAGVCSSRPPATRATRPSSWSVPARSGLHRQHHQALQPSRLQSWRCKPPPRRRKCRQAAMQQCLQHSFTSESTFLLVNTISFTSELIFLTISPTHYQ